MSKTQGTSGLCSSGGTFISEIIWGSSYNVTFVAKLQAIHFPEVFTLNNVLMCSRLQSTDTYFLSFPWHQKPEWLGTSRAGIRSQAAFSAALRGRFYYPRIRNKETEDHRLSWGCRARGLMKIGLNPSLQV